MAPKTKINEREVGRVLEEAEIVTSEQWQKILDLAQEKQTDIFTILEEEGLTTADEVGVLFAMQEDVSFVELRQHKIDAQAIRLVPAEVARERHIMPVAIIEETLVIAMEDPSDMRTIDSVKSAVGMPVEAVKATAQEIEEFLDIYYKASAEMDEQVNLITESLIKEAANQKGSTDLVADSPIARTVDMLMLQAIKDKASDVHIEPQE
ncbi:MAG: hypothetical protein GY852_10530, partial [bacterium]|nr:hypothetical protein [bacterium]